MKPFTKILALVTVAACLVPGLTHGALRTNLVNVTPGSADTLPAAMSKINTNLNDLELRVTAATNSPLVVPMPPSIYGANTDKVGIGTNGPNSMDVYLNAWRFIFGSGGFNFRDYTTDKVFLQGTRTLPLSQPFAYGTVQGGEVNQVVSDGYGRQPAGAGVTTYFNNLGGDGAALRSLPIRGPELWHRLKAPFVHIVGWYDGGGLTTLWAATNITSAMVTNAVAANVANGLLQAFTNRGVPVFVQIDATWMHTNRNSSGDLMVQSNQFPGGIEAPIRHAQAAGFKVQGGIYWDSRPTNYFTVDPAGNQGAYPKYQVMTAQTVNNDVLSFYQWGFDAIRVANTIPYFDTAGFQNQMVRQVADAVLNPNGFPWRREFGNNPMVLNVLLGDNGLNGFSETALLSANYVEADSEIYSLRSDRTELGHIFTNTVYCYERTARLCGKGHYATAYVVSDPGVPTPSMSTNQWRTDLSFGAMWGSGIQFNTNQAPWQIAQVTNSALMDIYFDTESHPAWMFMRNTDRQLGCVKPLANGAYGIWLFNDSATNHTWTLNLTNLFTPPLEWSPIQRPPQPPTTLTTWEFFDVWAKTNHGHFDNGGGAKSVATVTLTPTNSTLILARPVIGAGNLYFTTNALSAWPAAPLRPGDAYWGNSNGTVYLLTSGLGNTWTSTNKIAP